MYSRNGDAELPGFGEHSAMRIIHVNISGFLDWIVICTKIHGFTKRSGGIPIVVVDLQAEFSTKVCCSIVMFKGKS